MMKIILFLISFISLSVTGQDRWEYDVEDQKYQPDFHFETRINHIYIPTYSNGQITSTIFFTDSSQCDSVVNYHPNGEISLTARLFSYEKGIDTIFGGTQFKFWCSCNTYYPNGTIATESFMTDTLGKKTVFDIDGNPIFFYMRIQDSTIFGCDYYWNNDSTLYLKLIHNNDTVLVAKYDYAKNEVLEFSTKLSGINKTDLKMFEFDYYWYPNNIELLGIKPE